MNASHAGQREHTALINAYDMFLWPLTFSAVDRVRLLASRVRNVKKVQSVRRVNTWQRCSRSRKHTTQAYIHMIVAHSTIGAERSGRGFDLEAAKSGRHSAITKTQAEHVQAFLKVSRSHSRSISTSTWLCTCTAMCCQVDQPGDQPGRDHDDRQLLRQVSRRAISKRLMRPTPSSSS